MRLHNLLQVGDQPQPPGSIGLLTHPTLNLQLMMCLHNKWAHQLIHIRLHRPCICALARLWTLSSSNPTCRAAWPFVLWYRQYIDCGLGSRALPNASVFIQVLHRQTNTTPLDSLSPRCNTWVQAPSWDDTSCRKTSLN